jgi:hypothetical protein
MATGLHYEDIPGRRIGYHVNGCTITMWPDTNFVMSQRRFTEMNLCVLNNEDLDFYDCLVVHEHDYIYVCLFFPCPFDMDYMFLSACMGDDADSLNPTDATLLEVLTSKNTTNGMDGEWEASDFDVGLPYVPPYYPATAEVMEYRNTIFTAENTGIIALRFKWQAVVGKHLWLKTMHLYGNINLPLTWSAGSTYVMGDQVMFETRLYDALLTTKDVGGVTQYNLNKVPDEEPTWWKFNDRLVLVWCASGGGVELAYDKDFYNQKADGGSQALQKYNVSVKNLSPTKTACDVHVQVWSRGAVAQSDWNYQTSYWRIFNCTASNVNRLPNTLDAWEALFWTITIDGSNRIVGVYNNVDHAENHMVMYGVGTTGEIELEERNASGIFGYVTLSNEPKEDDDVDNILQIGMDVSATEYYDVRLTSDPDIAASYSKDLHIGDIAPGSYVNVTIRQEIPTWAVLGPHAIPVYIYGPDHWL